MALAARLLRVGLTISDPVKLRLRFRSIHVLSRHSCPLPLLCDRSIAGASGLKSSSGFVLWSKEHHGRSPPNSVYTPLDKTSLLDPSCLKQDIEF